MSALDDLIASLNTSPKLDATTRNLLVQFLQAGQPLLNQLETAALQDLLQWLAGGGSSVPATVDALDPDQVLALLTLTRQEMDAALQQRLAQVQATRDSLTSLANAALSILAQLLISSL